MTRFRKSMMTAGFAYGARCTRIYRTLALAVPGVALFAGSVLAAEEGSGNPWLDLLWKAVNTGILVTLLVVFARKPIGNLFRNAARVARETLHASKDAAASAETELAEQKEKIAGLRAELERMTASAREEAAAEGRRMIEEARAHAERIKAQIHLQLEQEMNKARKKLQAELAGETVKLAESLLASRLDEKGQAALVDKTIAQLGSGS